MMTVIWIIFTCCLHLSLPGPTAYFLLTFVVIALKIISFSESLPVFYDIKRPNQAKRRYYRFLRRFSQLFYNIFDRLIEKGSYENHRIVNPIAYENTYLRKRGLSLVVDPRSAWGAKFVAASITTHKTNCCILLPFTHYDHIMSLEGAGNLPVYVDTHEAAWLQSPVDNLSGLDRHSDLMDVVCPASWEHFDYPTAYHLKDFHFYGLHTPGHSIRISLVFPDNHLVLTGVPFRETGRTDLPTGKWSQLLEILRIQLLTLPSSYPVYPGLWGMIPLSVMKYFGSSFEIDKKFFWTAFLI